MIWIILTIGLILRLISINQSLWLDEAINVLATQNFSLLGMITEYAKADFHPPLFFIILWLWTKIFGIGEIAVRIPSIIFGVLTLYVVYLIGNKLYSRTLGLLSALLLAINPLHIYYSQEARMYAFAALAVSLNVLLLLKVVKKEKISLIILIISNLLVLLSDYVAYFIFPAQLIFLLILKQKEIFRKWINALLIAGIAGIWWIPIFLNQLNVGLVASSSLPTWKLVVGGFELKSIPLTYVKFIIGRISYPDKLIYAIILLPVGTLFLFLIWRGIKYIGDFKRNLLIVWVAVPIILATVISIVVPIYSYFRLLFVLPPFIILVSLGILSFRSKFKYALLVVVFIIQLFSAFVYLFNPAYQRDDWKGMVDFLKAKAGVTVLFESSGTLPPFDYYSGGEINAKGALKNFPAKEISDVADLEMILQGKKEVYLIEYLVDISDPQRLVQKRLSELNYQESEIHNFNGVGFVYHYVRR